MTAFTRPLISVDSLALLAAEPDVAIVDCRFELGDPERGRREYLQAHIPAAVYAHLDNDLSGHGGAGGGRHPLPAPREINERFAAMGMGSRTRVVAYDQGNGAIAARLWWMLRYMGHEAVAVLDGGFAAWRDAGRALQSGPVAASPGDFHGEPSERLVVTAEGLRGAGLLVDSRDGARYRGEHEPLDPVAGHVPGALHRFFGENLGPNGRFRDAASLRQDFEALLAGHAADEAVFYCGSGVTACHNLLAMSHAGLDMPRLYAGSWSDWCSDPSRPVARGSQPGELRA